ncbi:nucleotidyltransferase family protein [Selenomonas ruminantium]|uniref:nucleotidyltransferase family protein n=1 Tax=Selenomonas ruminantium TaxID=971 RepID=UPI000478D2F5|nr:nucleotidyltransferase domain-containing protein [Selenomonas ruminantium]
MDLPKHVHEGIIELAKKYKVKKVILFGSRARGDNWEWSDIDLAISGGNRTMFSLDVDEIVIVPTLLMYDVVDLDSACNEDLRAEIERDGVVLYEAV